MLLHKAVKNNPLLHIINFKGKMLLAGCMHTACICLLWLLPAENVTCYEMLYFQHTLVENMAYFGQARSYLRQMTLKTAF